MNPNAAQLKTGAKKMTAGAFFQKWGTLLTMVVLVVVFTFGNWNESTGASMWFTLPNWITIARAISITTVIAIGLTFSLSVNGMDLSIGSTASFAGSIIMTFFIWQQMAIAPAIILTIIICLIVAVFNSILIVGLKIPDMIAALSMMFAFKGVASTVQRGGVITENMTTPDGITSQGSVPAAFKSLGSEPLIIIVMLVVVLFAFFFLTYTKHGRYMYAVGGNPEAARLSGIPVSKYKILAYFLSSAFAALGGVMITARVGSAQPDGGGMHLMPSVAAAYIGFSVAGAGKANAIGTLVGAALVGILDNGLNMIGVPYYSMDIVKGAVLAIALALTYFRKAD